MAVERASVVNLHRLGFAGFRVDTFFDESLSDRRDVLDAAVEPDGGVDTVSEQIAGHAASRRIGIQTPGRRSALGNVRVDRPVLQEVGAVVKDLAEFDLRRSAAWPG